MADRVGYVLKKFPRLSETFILRELLGLGDAGLDLTVFSLRQPDPEPAQPEMQRLSADIEYLPWPTRAATLASFRLFAALRPAESSQLTRAFCFVDRLPEESRVSSFVQALHLAAVVERKEISHLHAHFMTVAARTTYLTHLLVGVPFSVTSHAKDIYRNTVDGGDLPGGRLRGERRRHRVRCEPRLHPPHTAQRGGRPARPRLQRNRDRDSAQCARAARAELGARRWTPRREEGLSRAPRFLPTAA